MNTNELTSLIDQTSDSILAEWTTEATSKGLDVDDYIGDQLDILAETEPEVCKTVGQRHLLRIMGVAA